MKKIYFITLAYCFLSISISYAQTTNKKEIKWKNLTYIQTDLGIEQSADLTGDGSPEFIHSFNAKIATSKESRTFTEIYEINPQTQKKELMKTIVGNISPELIRFSDINLDNVMDLIIFTKAEKYTTIQIVLYDYYSQDYLIIFEDGSVMPIQFLDGKLTSEEISPATIRIGRTNWSTPGAWSMAGKPLWEVYEWNDQSSIFIYSDTKSDVQWVGEEQDMLSTLKFYKKTRPNLSNRQMQHYGKRLFGARMNDLFPNY